MKHPRLQRSCPTYSDEYNDNKFTSKVEILNCV